MSLKPWMLKALSERRQNKFSPAKTAIYVKAYGFLTIFLTQFMPFVWLKEAWTTHMIVKFDVYILSTEHFAYYFKVEISFPRAGTLNPVSFRFGWNSKFFFHRSILLEQVFLLNKSSSDQFHSDHTWININKSWISQNFKFKLKKIISWPSKTGQIVNSSNFPKIIRIKSNIRHFFCTMNICKARCHYTSHNVNVRKRKFSYLYRISIAMQNYNGAIDIIADSEFPKGPAYLWKIQSLSSRTPTLIFETVQIVILGLLYSKSGQ